MAAAEPKFEPGHTSFTIAAPSEPPALLVRPFATRLQWYSPPRREYSRRELLADRIVNFSGAGFSWLATCIIGYASWAAGDTIIKQCSFWAQGLGMIVMLNCSALYHHWSWDWKASQKLLCLDHFGISFMIMGCYTPMMLQCSCYRILVFVLFLGFLGVGMEGWKLVRGSSNRSGGADGTWNTIDIIHVVRYVTMGWACVLAFPTMGKELPHNAITLAVIGGLLYTSGILVFIQGRREFHMAIWHLMVLVASLCFYSSNLFCLVGFDSDADSSSIKHDAFPSPSSAKVRIVA